MNNTKMIDLPWIDGTTRTVPEETVFATSDGALYAARDGGYSAFIDSSMSWGKAIYPHIPNTRAVRIFTEAPEPPVKVNVPTGIGAVVSYNRTPSMPSYVRTVDGWISLHSGDKYTEDQIALVLRNGGRVLFEGVAESEKSL